MGTAANDESRIAEILGDWHEARDQGEDLDPEDVINAHPELAGELRLHFEVLAAVEDALTRDSPSGPPRTIGEFRLKKPQIQLGEKVRRAVIVGNVISGPARITNRSQGSVEVGSNASD